MRRSRKVFRDGKVHVLSARCKTCIFRSGNLMQLNEGRVDQMIIDADRNETAIVCHSTLSGDQAVCRGYFDRKSSMTLRLAVATDSVRFVEVDSDGEK